MALLHVLSAVLLSAGITTCLGSGVEVQRPSIIRTITALDVGKNHLLNDLPEYQGNVTEQSRQYSLIIGSIIELTKGVLDNPYKGELNIKYDSIYQKVIDEAIPAIWVQPTNVRANVEKYSDQENILDTEFVLIALSICKNVNDANLIRDCDDRLYNFVNIMNKTSDKYQKSLNKLLKKKAVLDVFLAKDEEFKRISVQSRAVEYLIKGRNSLRNLILDIARVTFV